MNMDRLSRIITTLEQNELVDFVRHGEFITMRVTKSYGDYPEFIVRYLFRLDEISENPNAICDILETKIAEIRNKERSLREQGK